MLLVFLVLSTANADQPQPSRAEANLVRKKKMERLFADLASSFQKMLDIQLAVHEGSKDLHKVIQESPGMQPCPDDKRASLKLAGKEKAIVTEMSRVIAILDAEGDTIAFPFVLTAVCQDMKKAQRSLEKSDVGMETQSLEQDIIEALREMVGALKSH
jgi:hypothetical protein